MTGVDPAPVDGALSFLGDRLERNRPLGPETTYRVGGAAAWFVQVRDPDELASIAAAVAELRRSGADVPVLVLGNGSNLLVADRGFGGLALRLGEEFATVEIPEVGPRASRVVVRAGGATKLPVLAERTVAAGLTGFEWGKGVPGTVGGAVRMNAGGHGSDTAATLLGVRLVDLATGEDVEVDAAALDLGYRTSGLRSEQVVVHADLQLEVAPADDGVSTLRDIVTWRRANQPGGRNAGSVFTNPPGASAGALVDGAGCKGRRIGTAEISPTHANVNIAGQHGSADDVFALMVDVAAEVHRTSGVRLHPETCLIGFGDFDEALDRALEGSGDPDGRS